MTERKITRSLLAAFVVLGLTAACGDSDGAPSSAAESTPADVEPAAAAVDIKGFAFGPATITVSAGATVTWTNGDGFAHSVIADGDAFKSDELETSASFEHTFDEAGTYPYFCGIHNSMRGVIEVA